MTPRTKVQSVNPSGSHDANRNFILQQGLCEPAAETCLHQYSALLFQPRLVGVLVLVAAILRAPLLFLALGAVLWWSALAPRLNPFDALYNRTLARRSSATLTSAPPPRRFAQFLAGSFALTIGVSLALGWRMAALVLEGFFIIAVGALVFGGFCLGSFVFHLLCGRAEFAKRTLPWATGA
jgi:Domain of unknown function (DUF4395)